MSKKAFQLDFKTHTVHDWEKVAQQELRNKNPWENLTIKKAGVTIMPYYDSHDGQKESKVAVASIRSFQNIPKVIVNGNDTAANAESLNHLNTGADGIFFEIQSSPTKPKILLHKIELPFCSTYFSCEDDPSFINDFADLAESDKEKVSGAFFWKDALAVEIDWQRFATWDNFKSAGIFIPEKENIVDEIVDALCKAVDYLDRLINSGLTINQAFQNLAFSISVNTDFFLTVAKVRALKNVWLTLQEAYRIKNRSAATIHACSSVWLEQEFQPHGNLLKQTTSAMASVIGGCDALTLEPEDPDNPMMSRVARNISVILKEESYFAKVHDPLAGSFFIENLTHQIAAEAWTKFQQTR